MFTRTLLGGALAVCAAHASFAVQQTGDHHDFLAIDPNFVLEEGESGPVQINRADVAIADDGLRAAVAYNFGVSALLEGQLVVFERDAYDDPWTSSLVLDSSDSIPLEVEIVGSEIIVTILDRALGPSPRNRIEIYEKIGGAWSLTQSATVPVGIVSTLNDAFGEDLDATESFIAVGAPGAAFLFQRLPSGVPVFRNMLMSPFLVFGTQPDPGFGTAVAIDGGSLVVGGRAASPLPGSSAPVQAAYVYGVISMPTAGQAPPGVTGTGGGTSITAPGVPVIVPTSLGAISAVDIDAGLGLLTVGAASSGNGNGIGIMHTFAQLTPTTWSLPTTFNPTNFGTSQTTAQTRFGEDVRVSPDGSIVVVKTRPELDKETTTNGTFDAGRDAAHLYQALGGDATNVVETTWLGGSTNRTAPMGFMGGLTSVASASVDVVDGFVVTGLRHLGDDLGIVVHRITVPDAYNVVGNCTAALAPCGNAAEFGCLNRDDLSGVLWGGGSTSLSAPTTGNLVANLGWNGPKESPAHEIIVSSMGAVAPVTYTESGTLQNGLLAITDPTARRLRYSADSWWNPIWFEHRPNVLFGILLNASALSVVAGDTWTVQVRYLDASGPSATGCVGLTNTTNAVEVTFVP